MKYKILISEDEKNLANSWKRSLQQKGFIVDAAYDGANALQLWEKNPYDVILLDLQTPIIKGGELAQKIKTKQPWTPIIIITGEGKEQDKLSAIKQHVFDYLEKPVTLKEIITIINRALKSRDLILRSIESMLEQTDQPNQSIIHIKDKAYSAQQLFNEVRMGTEIGVNYRKILENELLDSASQPTRLRGFRINAVMD